MHFLFQIHYIIFFCEFVPGVAALRENNSANYNRYHNTCGGGVVITEVLRHQGRGHSGDRRTPVEEKRERKRDVEEREGNVIRRAPFLKMFEM